MRTLRFALIAAVLLAFAAPLHATSVNVAWDPNPEPNVRYVVYWGTQHLAYSHSATVGTSTSYIVSGLEPGQTYYFAVQAVTTEGLASPFSEEVSTTIPAGAANVRAFTTDLTGPATMGFPITWKASASGAGQLEYKFRLYNQATDQWTVLQEYQPNPSYTWIPSETGTYSIDVWVRNVGSTATYEDWSTSGLFVVSSGAPQVGTLLANPQGPVRPGQNVVLTCVAGGGSAPLQYRFWVRDPSGVWTTFRDYASSNQATWKAGAVGDYGFEVWVRQTGSSSYYDSRNGDLQVHVITDLKIESLTPNVSGPVSVGTPVTLTAVAGGVDSIEYKFWVLRNETGLWSVIRNYSPSPQAVWAPTQAGNYMFQVWARRTGSTQENDAWRSAGPFQVTAVDAGFSLDSLTVDQPIPVLLGRNVTFDAHATGTAPLEFKFWLTDPSTQQWMTLREYDPSSRAQWVPSAPGDYQTQVWARKAGSSAAYEAWKPGPTVVVATTKVKVKGVWTPATLPAPVGSAIQWTAVATAMSGASLEYQFRLQNAATGQWTVLQPWSGADTTVWIPTAPGTYNLQVLVRSLGSLASFEGWRDVTGIVIQ